MLQAVCYGTSYCRGLAKDLKYRSIYMNRICVLLFSLIFLVTSCKDAEHLKTPDPELITSMRRAMEQSYTQSGLNPDTAHNRRHQNTAYQLALHVLDEPDWLQRIQEDNPQASTKLQAWGSDLVHRVQRQRQGFPVPTIIDQLNTHQALSKDQQLLLLGCIIKLQVDADMEPELIELRR